MNSVDKYSGQIFHRKIRSGKLRFLHIYNEEKYSLKYSWKIFHNNIPEKYSISP